MTPDDNFDPEAFLASTVVNGEMSTQVLNCPEGKYRAQIDDKIEVRSIDTKNGPRKIVRVLWNILDDTVKAQLERERVLVSQDLWLDFDETGALDTRKGKNVDLGVLRDALGQNKMDGWTFGMLRGQIATVQVSHRSQDDNPARKFAEVRRVGPAQ